MPVYDLEVNHVTTAVKTQTEVATLETKAQVDAVGVNSR